MAPLPPAAYAVFPVMVFVAFRFHQIGVATATVVITCIALLADLKGLGPFVNGYAPELNLIYLQIFVLTVSVTAMFLAITASRHLQAEAALGQLSKQLREANERVTKLLEGVLEKDGR
jgi:integral membrane sensor domain MASE1